MEKPKPYSLTDIFGMKITIQNVAIDIIITADDISHVRKKGLTNILINRNFITFKNFMAPGNEEQFDITIINNKLRAINVGFTFYTTITDDELLEAMLRAFIQTAQKHPNNLDKIDQTHTPKRMKNDTIYAMFPVKKFSVEKNTAIVQQALQIILESKITKQHNIDNSEKTYGQIIHELKEQDKILF